MNEPRTLLFGVGVTPTKPLLPTHLKGLVWMETAIRATELIAKVDCVASTARVLWDSAAQTIRFWAYLDEHPEWQAEQFYADKDDVWVGERYVEYSAKPADLRPEVLERYRHRIEDEGWVHPSARQVLAAWDRQHAVLGLRLPRRERPVRFELDDDQSLERLGEVQALLDLRAIGGGAFLDMTRRGLPLRTLIDELGRPNYVHGMVRMLLGLAPGYARTTLLFDAPVQSDFVLISAVLRALELESARIALERVELPGVAGSTRAGGWQPFTCDAICARYLPRYDAAVVRLGLRIYFILHTALRVKAEFSYDEVDRAMTTARRIVDVIGPDPVPTSPDELAALLVGFATKRFFRDTGLVDPHAVLGLLFQKDALRRNAAAIHALCM